MKHINSFRTISKSTASILILLSSLMHYSPLFSQPDFNWSQKVETTVSGYAIYQPWVEFMHPGAAVLADSKGNVIISGTHGSTIDIDGSSNTQLLTFYGSNDMFVASYTAQGNVRWGFSLGSALQDYPMGIAVDSSDNVYLSGMFHDSIDLDPDSGIHMLTQDGTDRDLFIAKYDSAGTFVQAMQINTQYINPSAGFIYKIEFDSQQNMIVMGSYQGMIDLDPGPGINTLPLGANVNYGKSFIAKYDTNLQLLNAWPFLSPSSNIYMLDLVMASDNGFYITGDFTGNFDFDPGSATLNLYSLDRCGFVARYDSLCNPVWVKMLNNTMNYQSQSEYICKTPNDDVIIVGFFSGSLRFPLSSGDTTDMYASADYYDRDLYMAAYAANGDVRWAKHFPATQYQAQFNGLEFQNSTNTLFTSFTFPSQINLDPGNTNFEVSTGAFPDYDMALARFDNSNGDFIDGYELLSPGPDYNYIDVRGDDLYMMGMFTGTLDLDLSTVINDVQTDSDPGIFISKYALPVNISTSLTDQKNHPSEISFNNLISTEIKLNGNLREFSAYKIYSVDGKIISEGRINGEYINTSDLSDGLYLLYLSNGTNIAHTYRFVKQTR